MAEPSAWRCSECGPCTEVTDDGACVYCGRTADDFYTLDAARKKVAEELYLDSATDNDIDAWEHGALLYVANRLRNKEGG